MNNLLFSIVIPVYNVEKYVGECIESVIKQTYENWEIILVNDGSTDQSEDICNKYSLGSERICLYVKENGGLADSRNFGISKAKGDYLIFIDSDDYIAYNTLENCVSICEKYTPDIIMSEGMYEIYGSEIGGYKNWNSSEYQGLDGKETLRMTMKKAPNWSPCGKCYRKEFWDYNQFRFLKGRLAEDFELIDKVVLKANKVYMIPSFYYYRRFRENSIVTKKTERLIRDLKANICEREIYFKQEKLDSDLIGMFQEIHANIYCHDILGCIYLVRKDERHDLLMEASELLYLLKYGVGIENRVVCILVKIIGLNTTCKILALVKKCRIKKERSKINDDSH